MPASGWHGVLEAVVRERGASLTAYARLFTGDRTSAEDLVQEALVRTFGRRRHLEGVAPAEAYVRQAIRTAFLDRARRTTGWRARRHLLADTTDAPGPERSVVARLDVQAALCALSPRERACVVLRYFDDLTVPEVARELSLSEGAVKRYLSDAVRRLRTELGPETGVDDELVVVRAHVEGA